MKHPARTRSEVSHRGHGRRWNRRRHHEATAWCKLAFYIDVDDAYSEKIRQAGEKIVVEKMRCALFSSEAHHGLVSRLLQQANPRACYVEVAAGHDRLIRQRA